MTSMLSGALDIVKNGFYGAGGSKISEIVHGVGARVVNKVPILGYLNPLNILSKITPTCVQNFLTQGPLHQALAKANVKMFELFGSMKLASTIGVPVLEEAIFRFGLQQGLTYCLIAAGVEPTIAKATSIFLSSVVFAMSHDAAMDSQKCTGLALKGAAFGATYEASGYLAAVVAHALNNFREHYLPSLQNPFSSSTGQDDLSSLAQALRKKDE